MNIGNLFLALLADGARLGPSVQAEAQKAGDAGGQTLAKAMGDKLRANAGKIFASIGAGIGAFIAGSTQEFAKFDDQMREVFSIMPGISKAAMDKMKDDVLGVSREFGILTDDLIPALGLAIGSGIPENNVMDFLRVAAKAAKAGATDTQTSVKALAATLNAFHIPVEKANEVADSFFNAIDKGVTSFPELAASMSDVAPAAAAMGLSLEDVLAAVTAMTLQGTSTSSAITQVQASLTALQRTTPEMDKALKNLGFTTGQAMLDTLGYQGSMVALRAEAEKMGVPLIDLTGRLEGTSAILQLTGENALTAEQILRGFGDVIGKTDAAFEVMEGGIGGFTRRTLADLKAWAIEVGSEFQALGPVFVLFGPTAGRAIGAGMGAAFGAITPHIAKLGAKIVQRLGFALLSGGIADAAATAIGQGLDSPAVTKTVQSAGGKVGKVFGLAFGIAAVAAIALVLADLGEKQIEEDAKPKVREMTERILADGTREGLERGIAQMRAMAHNVGRHNPVFGEWIESQIPALELALQKVNGQVTARMSRVSADAADSLRNGQALVTAGATTMVGGMDTAWVAAARKAGYGVGKGVVTGFYAGITERQSIVQLLLEEALSADEKTMDKAGEVAYLIGVLTSEELANGVNDKRANVRAAYEETQRVAEERLRQLGVRAPNISKEAMDRLIEGQRSKDPDVKKASDRTADIIAAEIAASKTRDAGRKAGREAAAGLASTNTLLGAAAAKLGRAIVLGILGGVRSTNVGGSGQKSTRGLASGGHVAAHEPVIVGEKRPELFVPEVAGYVVPDLSVPQVRGHVGSVGSSAGALTVGGDTINNNITVPVTGLPIRAETPSEIVLEMRRATRLGLAPRQRARSFSG